MKDLKIIEAIQSSSLLPPTLAAELLQALPTLSTEKVDWILSILQHGNAAERRYSEAAARIEELLKENRSEAEREALFVAEPVLSTIMAEFDSELELLLKEP